MAGVGGRRDRILLLIALARWTQAAVLLAAGFVTFHLLRPGAAQQIREWITALPFTTEQRVGQRVLMWLLGAGPRRVQLLGVSAFAYAALFAVEGIGLWLQKRWAEYLTIVATSSLVPLEIYEVVKRVTILRIAVLVSNVAIVAYLVWKVRTPRRGLTARE
jgi:uncharacterized membrane protein (DUF2068 family)